MGGINVAGHLFMKKVVKDLSGNIIDLYDEIDGGYIIRKRQIVNPEKWAKIQEENKQKAEAAKAQSMQKVDANAPDRTASPSKVDLLEKKVNDMGSKLDAILNALNDKKS